MIQRSCQFSKTNSFFLFGARGTGKTTLLNRLFSKKDTLFIDLLNVSRFEELLLDISRFENLINTKENKNKRVVVDEVQKLPQLLDIIHSQIQKKKRQFVLTGSSSRKLKQKGTNLLAGRAWVYHLYPFSSFEMGRKFNLKRALEWGALPEAVLAKDRESAREYLNAYVGTYLEKEIQQEQWVRKLQPFRRFLSTAAQMNGKIVNKSKIARDIGVDDVTVANYFEILEDTLLGISLPAFHLSVRKAQKQAPKFYFIDTGIKRALQKTLTVELLPQTFSYGEAFEHWLLLEVIKNASYQRKDWTYSYLRTKEGLEIDLIIQRPKDLLLIEIKSKDRVSGEDAKALSSLAKDIDPKAKKWLVSRDTLERDFNSVRALPWQKALKELFI
ncbi:MAG: AAA family ATPase [Oligoflexia bacterium]|nr:AAA family ATPase [Oligoflexia bacterium]